MEGIILHLSSPMQRDELKLHLRSGKVCLTFTSSRVYTTAAASSGSKRELFDPSSNSETVKSRRSRNVSDPLFPSKSFLENSMSHKKSSSPLPRGLAPEFAKHSISYDKIIRSSNVSLIASKLSNFDFSSFPPPREPLTKSRTSSLYKASVIPRQKIDGAKSFNSRRQQSDEPGNSDRVRRTLQKFRTLETRVRSLQTDGTKLQDLIEKQYQHPSSIATGLLGKENNVDLIQSPADVVRLFGKNFESAPLKTSRLFRNKRDGRREKTRGKRLSSSSTQDKEVNWSSKAILSEICLSEAHLTDGRWHTLTAKR